MEEDTCDGFIEESSQSEREVDSEDVPMIEASPIPKSSPSNVVGAKIPRTKDSGISMTYSSSKFTCSPIKSICSVNIFR